MGPSTRRALKFRTSPPLLFLAMQCLYWQFTFLWLSHSPSLALALALSHSIVLFPFSKLPTSPPNCPLLSPPPPLLAPLLPPSDQNTKMYAPSIQGRGNIGAISSPSPVPAHTSPRTSSCTCSSARLDSASGWCAAGCGPGGH